MARSPERGPSVFSRFRLSAIGVILGVVVVGTFFDGMLRRGYTRSVIETLAGSYSRTVSDRVLATRDPEVWSRIAAEHEVTLRIEPADGPAATFDPSGATIPWDPVSLERAQIQALGYGGDGSRVVMTWSPLARSTHALILTGRLVTLCLLVGSVFWFLQRQLAPLAALRQGVDAVARGQLEVEVPVARNDEIGEVAGAFNAMAARVAEMIDDRERMLGDVSHELRSPIARMKVALELLPEGTKREALVRDLGEMEDLIALLLERERLRSKARHGTFEVDEVELRELATDLIGRYADRSPQVVLAPGDPVAAQVDAGMIRLLLHNLVDNALKFSHADSLAVRVVVESDGDGIALRVIDDGVGVEPGLQKRVFEPFVKASRARGHHVGYGIGLNLCQRIVELHGGSIELRRAQPRGTEAIVMLPAKPRLLP